MSVDSTWQNCFPGPRESKVFFIQSVLMFTGWAIILYMENIKAWKRTVIARDRTLCQAFNKNRTFDKHMWQLKKMYIKWPLQSEGISWASLSLCFEWLSTRLGVDLLHHLTPSFLLYMLPFHLLQALEGSQESTSWESMTDVSHYIINTSIWLVIRNQK